MFSNRARFYSGHADGWLYCALDRGSGHSSVISSVARSHKKIIKRWMTMGKQADVHVKILNAQSTDALMSVYDDWADRYETELLDDWGYTSPQMAVTLLQRYSDINGSSVLDAGCGTGLLESFWLGQGSATCPVSTTRRACWTRQTTKVFISP